MNIAVPPQSMELEGETRPFIWFLSVFSAGFVIKGAKLKEKRGG